MTALALGLSLGLCGPPAAAAAAPPGLTLLQVTGPLTTEVGDDFADGRSTTSTWLRLDGREVPVDLESLGDLPAAGVFTGTIEVPTGLVRSSTGHATARLASALARRPSPVVATSGTVAPLADAALTPVAQHAYVAKMTNAGDFNLTDTQLHAVLGKVLGYWADQSDGVMSSFSEEGFKTFTSSHTGPEDRCGLKSTQTVAAEGRALYPDVDFAPDAPNHLIVMVPDECIGTGGNVGIGSFGSGLTSGGTVVAAVDTYAETTLAHELGHNFGLDHAHVGDDAAGDRYEYGNIYSVMGYAQTDGYDLPALNSSEREAFGLVADDEVEDLWLPNDQTSADRVVTLDARSASAGPRSVRVLDPDSGVDYVLEYRSGAGPEAHAFYMDGAWPYERSGSGLAVLRTGRSHDSHIYTSFADPVGERFTVRPGETFSDSQLSFTVAVTSMTATQLTATVHFAPRLPSWNVTPAEPTVNGTPEVGQQLVAHSGGWPDGVSQSADWFADGVLILAGSADVYLRPSQRGTHVWARLVTTDYQHRPWVQLTPSVGPVQQRIKVYGPDVYVNVPPEVGQAFSSLGTPYTDPAGIPVQLQWNADGAPIPGATGSQYTPTTADVGKRLSITSTASQAGYLPGTHTGQASPPVKAPVVPTLQAETPSISGQTRLESTLTADPGTWPQGPALTLQWLRDGIEVPGATSASYPLGAGDVGARFRVRVTGTKPGYQSASAESFDVGPVAPGRLASPRPNIAGQARVAKTLAASAPGWTPGASLVFDWMLGSTVIGHGTTLKLPKSAAGKKVYVRVTGSLPGYQTVSETSPSVKVKPKKKKRKH